MSPQRASQSNLRFNLEHAPGPPARSHCETQGKCGPIGFSTAPGRLLGGSLLRPSFPTQGRPPRREKKAEPGSLPCPTCSTWRPHPEVACGSPEVSLMGSVLRKTSALTLALSELLKQTHNSFLIFRVGFKTRKLLRRLRTSGVGTSKGGVSEGSSESEV